MGQGRSLIIATALAIAIADLAGADPQWSPTPPIIQIPPGAPKAKVLVLRSPRADYPLYARKHHWVGVGWCLMNVDKKTGVVTSVEILQSTGHKVLDQCAVAALQQWKFKPGTVWKVKTPITFQMPVEKAAE